MSDLLVIDWDSTHVRALVGSRSGSILRASKAAMAPIEGEATAANIADALRPLVSRLHSGRSKVLVVLGGRDVQSRLLRVPPVPKAELPDVVRLRASTEFPRIDDSATIDYLPLDSDGDETATVFAARISPNTLVAARNVCTHLHLTPESIVMRGCGIQRLANHELTDLSQGVHLIVALRGGDLDLVGSSAGQTVAVRSVSVPGEDDIEVRAQAAAREMRRTIAAISSEQGSRDMQSLVWIVGSEQDAQIAERCGRDLSRRITQIDIRSLGESSDAWPAEAAGFAGMLGSGYAMSSRDLPIDFLAPRKPPEKKTPVATLALAGVLAALVIVGGGWMAYSNVAKIQKEAKAAEQEQKDLEADLEQLAPDLKQAAEVEQWLATDVNWLDELDRLATTIRPHALDAHDDYDPEGDILLDSIVAKQAPARNGRGGNLTISGGARNENRVKEIEHQLRDDEHQVNPGLLDMDDDEKTFVWSFRDEIVVTPSVEERR
ncbi:hypothetical protein NG895_27110 [Aeoliella sp. ICT_H6.2]|uniref:Competence protein A n=1 Tax=Aeoliella straminimaris TaxID=2954799 RepID=A0A9X2JJ83_9BACT|nr:hypothetical protein [Aeoliella straminimaris]MCO6047591.1 hypothetical protein [Aeoliella straminimaris]